MSGYRRISTGTPWESIAGFSRAVRVKDMIYVSGTTASDEHGQTVGGPDAAAQCRYALQKIQRALESAGASLSHVVRTRIYITGYANWEAVARVHGEFFRDIAPANTLVVVRSLVPDDALVEIEVEAVLA